MKVLIVDDYKDNRELLEYMLLDEGVKCVQARNGLEACEIYGKNQDIDIILMDVSMPEMNGIEATAEIKSRYKGRLIPVIFVTAMDDASVMAECLGAGGDDFVPKPINADVLLAKVKAHARTLDLYNSLRETKKEIERNKKLMDREHAIVERIFNRASVRVKTFCSNVKHYSSPMSMFNGDITLEAPSPSGGVYCLVGDFTGHGLASSIGTLPVMEIFYRMAQRQSSIGLIAKEINGSLVELLPKNMFFCAALCYLDNTGRSLSLWAGGMNDVLRLYKNNITEVPSEHMPLGILSEEEFDDTPLALTLEVGERLYIHTDGVNEATNSSGEEFGLENIKRILLSGKDDLLNVLTETVHNFESGIRNDDISVMEITAGPLEHYDKLSEEKVDIKAKLHQVHSFPWKFQMRLEQKELASTSIVDQIMAIVSGVDGVELHQENIFTIVSELYSNALEHGILGLDSALKCNADGFSEYYRLRAERLENIGEDFIELCLTFHKADISYIELEITDSGEGFDFNAINDNVVGDFCSFGRGLPLLQRLCTNLSYSNEGRTAKAIYTLAI